MPKLEAIHDTAVRRASLSGRPPKYTDGVVEHTPTASSSFEASLSIVTLDTPPSRLPSFDGSVYTASFPTKPLPEYHEKVDDKGFRTRSFSNVSTRLRSASFVQARKSRLCMCGMIGILSAVLLLSASISTDVYLDKPRYDSLHKLAAKIHANLPLPHDLKRASPPLRIHHDVAAVPHAYPKPPECREVDFHDPGWIVHATTSNEGQSEQFEHPSLQLRKTAGETTFTQACADQWISRGTLCDELLGNSRNGTLPEAVVDFAWTFVEDSNHWVSWKDYYATGQRRYKAEQGTRTKNFRSHDQLRYGIRSVIKNAPFMRKASLLSASLPIAGPPESQDLESHLFEQTLEGTASCRIMQAPFWLNASLAVLPSSRIQLVSHWDAFSTSLTHSITNWRTNTLPVFNSHAIESQLANIADNAETLVYLNDDAYLSKRMEPSDFSSALFGPVIRFRATHWVLGRSRRGLWRYDPETRNRVSASTVGLIDERFGHRLRPWLEHIAHTISIPMAEECSMIWGRELKETAEVRFRGRGTEYYLPLLSSLYVMEKHREALLWSLLMARTDADESNSFSADEKSGLLSAIGGKRSADTIVVRVPLRSSATQTDRNGEVNALLHSVGLAVPRETVYRWTSRDTYAFFWRSRQAYPQLDGRDAVFCRLNITVCFGSEDFFDLDETESPPAQWIFQNVAFAQPKCGDCILAAMLNRAGIDGLEPFLPPSDAPPEASYSLANPAPFIGGPSSDWRLGDFSLNTALQFGKWHKRDFAVRLIQRYSYVLGESTYAHEKMHDQPASTEQLLSQLYTNPVAFISLNDGLSDYISPEEEEEHERILQDWHRAMWPIPSEIENLGHAR